MKLLTALLAFGLSALLVSGPSTRAQENESDVAAALRQAEEQAKKLGIKMPDMTAGLSEVEADEAKEKAALQKQLEATDAVAFPLWMPKVPDFKPDGPATKKIVDDQVHLIQTGTSPRTPAELGDAWEATKRSEMSFGRSNSSVNDNKTVTITFSTFDETREEVELEATRGPKDKITRVTISSALPKPDVD